MNRREVLGFAALAMTGSGFSPERVRSMTAASRADKRPKSKFVGRPYVEATDGTRIHFRDWGTGRPIVFVAPWGLCSDWWDIPVTNFSERGWRCVTFDRRGHGRSGDACRGYDCDILADDIAAVLNERDVQNAVLVGHSMGGAEVVRYLTRHQGHRVKHAVLVAPTTPFVMKSDDNPSGASREDLEEFRRKLKDDLPRRAAEAAPDFFGLPKNSVSKETMDWWCRMLVDRVSIKVLTELNKAQTETDFRPELRTIRTPTLILHGDIDKSAPLESTGRPTHELLPGSRLLVYENAAHALPFTHTDRMLTDIVAFAGS
jgi:non-heme chloroperoxidase